ncbi:MAG: alpha-galactosidase [Ruminococcaceae bacterium]|nr:alpha-galactosidase [Oscillospiraceae bacterium]
MKKMRSVIALLLAVLAVLPLAACGGEGVETESGTEADTEKEGISVGDIDENVSDYLTTYSDYDAAKKWIKENIEDTNTPPVVFKVGKKYSYDYEWTKTKGEPTIVTDFAASEKPVKRCYYDIVYTNTELGFEITVTVTSYPNYPVVEYDAKIKNINKGNSPEIMDLKSLDSGLLETRNATIHFNDGGYYAETCFQARTETVSGFKNFELTSELGMTSANYLPFFNAENSEIETGVITAVNWQGDWQYGQNIWRRWIIDHNMMRYSGHRDFKENVFLCSSLMGATPDLQAVNAVAKTDIPTKFNCVFELDAPWYDVKNTNVWYYLGHWNPGKFYANGGLKKVSDLCHKKGIQFCLWLEPERFAFNTPQAKKIGNNGIYLNNGGYISYDECVASGFDPGWDNLLNYSKQEAVDYAIDLVDSTIKEYGMDVYRQDFNTNNGPYWWAYDSYQSREMGIPRTGATENLACKGYINVWTALAEKNPGLVFDACAGGGRRLDLETLRFSFAHTKSDWNVEIISQQCQNFSAYSWYIFTGTGLMAPLDKYDTRTRLTLSIGVLCTGNSDFRSIEKGLDEWKSLHKYIWKDFYQISSLSYEEDANLAMQFHDHENGEGMMIGYLRKGGEYTFVAKGLDPDAEYKITDRDTPDNSNVMTGAELMSEGFTVSYKKGSGYAAIAEYALNK